VITSDNLVLQIDTVVYYQVTNAKSALYEIESFVLGIEQITITTLRNVVGGIDLEQALTSRETINSALRGVLDEATGKWGVRVNRVEIKSIEPPETVKVAMEMQMRADREKRAAILTAEGEKQSQILTAEGRRQAAILNAEGEAKARILNAEAEAKAVKQVFEAVKDANLDDAMLAYRYLEMLPRMTQGDSNKVWIIPGELSGAIEKLSQAFRPGKS
jgi:regulator of protease activity HflC (stomatin/prohibitin superfamily)